MCEQIYIFQSHSRPPEPEPSVQGLGICIFYKSQLILRSELLLSGGSSYGRAPSSFRMKSLKGQVHKRRQVSSQAGNNHPLTCAHT